MNAHPIKNILLIFAIGLGRVKMLRDFLTACRNVVHLNTSAWWRVIFLLLLALTANTAHAATVVHLI